MLLQRLVEYAGARNDAGPPFHRDLEFHWQLELNGDGTLSSPELTPLVDDSSGKVRGVRHVAPSIARTVGVAPQLAADDIQYVLGWTDDHSKPDRVSLCHEAFKTLSSRWARSEAGALDPVAQAVWRFYADDGGAKVRRPTEFTSKQRVIIAVGGVPAYGSASVIPFWSAQVASRKGTGAAGLCLVCGQTRSLLDTLPGKVKSTLVPGASNDASLVSINEPVFGYDLSTQLGATPVCVSCGEAVNSALVELLESDHATSYSDQDSRLTWWLTGRPSTDPMRLLDQADPGDVVPWLESVHKGRPGGAPLEETSFCSLTVGGNIARIMVRDWVEMPLSDLERNIATWFDDHEMSPVGCDGRRHQSLYWLARCLGRWDRQGQRYSDFGTRGADRPADVQRALQSAAIKGWPVALPVLRHLLHRVSSDGHLDDARAAVIRLCLTRSPLTLEKPMPDLDTSNADPAYVAGRIFAVLEQIQDAANPNRQLNTTYGDRYFSGAVLNPRAAITSGRRDAKAWLKKLRRDGVAHYRERDLDELFALIDPHVGLPARASLLQQSNFILGYHQQRAHRWAQIRAHRAAADTTPIDPAHEEIQQ